MFQVLLALAVMLATCGLAGAGLTAVLPAGRFGRRCLLHLGYAYTLVAFYLAYCLFNAATPAVLLTLALPLGAWAAAGLRGRLTFASLRAALPLWRFPAGVGVVVLLVAGWPNLVTGWGKYWLSGTRDIEDGLNGRDAYLENKVFDARLLDLGFRWGDRTRFELAKATGANPNRTGRPDSFREWYAGDNFRFQYSSLAFWSALLRAPHGADVFLVQALLNLVLMALGIYFLARDAFGLGDWAAAVSAAGGAGSTFYLTTYFAGHEGSLMYGALAPALMHGVLDRDDSPSAGWIRWVLLALVAGAIGYSYPHPLVIVAPALAADWLLRRPGVRASLARAWTGLRARPLLLAGLALALVGLTTTVTARLWIATESFRAYQSVQYRAWGFLHDWLAMPLFLGLLPPPMEGLAFVGSMLSAREYWLLIGISAAVSLWAVYGYLRAAASSASAFLWIFAVVWVGELVLFKYFIVDSYYLYKFLYTHQFVLVIALTAFVARSRSAFHRIAGGLVLLSNLGCDLYLAQKVHTRPFNQEEGRYRRVLDFDWTQLRQAFITVSGGDGVALRQTLKTHGIEPTLDPRDAAYFVVQNGRDADITAVQLNDEVARSGLLALKRAPAANYLMVRAWNEPEQFRPDALLRDSVFRWLGGGRQDYLGIWVVRPELTPALKSGYLRLCLQRGPSALGDLPVTIADADHRILARLVLTGGVHAFWLPAEEVLRAPQPLIVHSGAPARSLLPHDDRTLLYRAFALGWTDRKYDNTVSRFFNRAEGDILRSGGRSPVTIRLGQGWEAFETYQQDQFRWVGTDAEIVLSDAAGDGVAHVIIELEPGPSHGPRPLELEIRDDQGVVVGRTAPVIGRNEVTVDLPFRRQTVSVYTLHAPGENRPVPGDARNLNYRVFRLAVP